MVKVSIGFVRSLQDSILRLERNQQYLISQLDHANSLATEYHETSCMYHQKYDEALHDIEELRQKHEYEISVLFNEINQATQDAQSERAIRQIHAEQIVLLERQIAQQVNYSAVSQATTVPQGSEDQYYIEDHEIMSPVSVASLSPRAPRYGYGSPRLDPETPDADADAYNSEDDEDEDEEQSDNETEREFQMRYYHESLSSQTTDCSGDPICNSDRDSDNN